MCGALLRFHDPRALYHRLAEVLEPFGGISFTDDAGEGPDARAAMLGQAEAVITWLPGYGRPFWPRLPFLDLPNVLGSPRNSGLVPGVVTESLLDAARNVAAYLGGGPVRGIQDPADYQPG